MSRKLQTIQNLKTRLIKMHQDLEEVAAKKSPSFHKQAFNQTVNLSQYQSTPVARTTSKEKEPWKNPTFWGENPIFGKQNKETKKWQKPKINREPRQLSPKLCKILKEADSIYYNSRQQSGIMEFVQKPEKKMQEPPRYFTSKRFEYSHHGQAHRDRETPRFQKIKTYSEHELRKIINTSKSKSPSGRKIVRPMEKSPENIYTNSPSSNPHLYFFKERQTSLSPKSCYSNKKNKSPNMGLVMSPAQEQTPKNPSKSQKKHFSKYFTDTMYCNWN